jgi:HAD superfamily hydrolase (TIGR01549 family)
MNTVLFDLDGTLLPMEQKTFLSPYFRGLAAFAASVVPDAKRLLAEVWAGIDVMEQPRETLTNEEAFWRHMSEQFGAGAADELLRLWDVFYREEFPRLQNGVSPTPRANACVKLLRAKGYRVVLATNPVFPRAATLARMAWAGLDTADFAEITTYEDYHAGKPFPAYYEEVLHRIGRRPADCLMVGNDVQEDMVAAEAGLSVFLLTDCLIDRADTDLTRYPHGDFDALTAYLSALPPAEEKGR